MSPTQRTLKWLRDGGHLAAVVERWNPHIKIRQDLFGCLDILSVYGEHTYGWQVTSTGVKERVTKLLENDCIDQLRVGMRVSVVGWRKLKVVRGKRAERYFPRVVALAGRSNLLEFPKADLSEVEAAF